MACKKRQHPDELLDYLGSSLPKRLFASSEADSVSWIDHRPVISEPHGSIWNNSPSLLFSSDCSPRSCGLDQSSISTDAGSQTLVLTASRSYERGPLMSVTESLRDDKAKQKSYGAPYISNNGGKDSDVEVSEVTVDNTHAHTLFSSLDEPKRIGNVTHVISRREEGSIGTCLVSDEPRLKASCGYGDYATWGRQADNKSRMIPEARQYRDEVHLLAGSETWATRDSFFGAPPRPQYVSVHAYGSRQTEIQTSDNELSSRSSYEALPPSFSTSDSVSVEAGASYVLSSGRLSLEEEARLGHRAPTIDRDFEEYFSTLML